MTRQYWAVYSAVAGFATVGLGCLIALWTQQMPVQVPVDLQSVQLESAPATATLPAAATAPAAQALPIPAAPVAAVPVAPARSAAAAVATDAPDQHYYSQLRSRIRWVPTTIGGDRLLTPDLDSRLLLAKSAAGRAGLPALGLGFKDVYGIINAETSWVPRLGASKNGTPNLGIAQFEPATARALGMRNPNDPVEAVHAAALHMKEAALWSADRIGGLKLSANERSAKLREGISIYYNLSTRGRNLWNGRNTAKLPRETQLHIQNARIGTQQAEFFDAQLRAMKTHRVSRPAVMTASR